MDKSPFTLRISANALADTIEIFSWYETKAQDLGEQFLNDLEITYQHILSHPTAFARFKKGSKARKKLLSIFPYKVFYLVEDGEVKILAIIHTSRSQKFLKKRIK